MHKDSFRDKSSEWRLQSTDDSRISRTAEKYALFSSS